MKKILFLICSMKKFLKVKKNEWRIFLMEIKKLDSKWCVGLIKDFWNGNWKIERI